MSNPKEAGAQAAAAFKKEQQARDGAKAMAEYEAHAQATRDKTARLRSLRLAKEAAELETAKKKAAPARAKRKGD